jgi:hypothetical protein
MAMAGHSAGGAATIAAMLADSRIRAGIDMDGSTAALIPHEGLARPFLFLGKQSSYTPGSGAAVTPGTRDWKRLRGCVITWVRDWELLTGWKRWFVVAGAVHASFTGLALLAAQTGIDVGAGLSGARNDLAVVVPGSIPEMMKRVGQLLKECSDEWQKQRDVAQAETAADGRINRPGRHLLDPLVFLGHVGYTIFYLLPLGRRSGLPQALLERLDITG